MRNCAPSFLVLGFGRCGTTSLAKYLSGHPRLGFGTRKEHFYFYRPEFCDLQHGPNNHTNCAVERYASQFPVLDRAPGRDVTFDATPMLGGDMGVPASDRTMAWLRAALPALRFLVLVKSPAERFASNPLAAKKLERLQVSLEAGANAMPSKLGQLLGDNCYADKLEKWRAYFPAERFLLLKSDDLRGPVATRQRLLDDVHAFLDVPPFAYRPEDLAAEEHVRLASKTTASNATVSDELRATVDCLPLLRDCERRLEALLAAPLGALDWCASARKRAAGFVAPRLVSSAPPARAPPPNAAAEARAPPPPPPPKRRKRRWPWAGREPDI